MARLLTYNATLIKKQTIADGLGIFDIRLDEELPIKPEIGKRFVPGQYMTIGLNRPDDNPNDHRPVSVVRPMSLASAPEQTDLQFYVRYVSKPNSDLPLTHLLFAQEDGARMFVRPSPTGNFTEEHTFDANSGKSLLMLAAGTGLAPFMSMVRSKVIDDPNADLSRYAIIHGVSNPNYLGYMQELQELAKKNNLRYLPTVSRPHESEGWQGSFGRAEQTLAPERIEETEKLLGISLRPENTTISICGLNGTVKDTIKNLSLRGYIPHHRRLRKAFEIPEEMQSSLYYEQYDSEPVVDLKNELLVFEMKKQIHDALALSAQS